MKKPVIFLFLFFFYFNSLAQHTDQLYEGLFTIEIEPKDLKDATVHGISTNDIIYLRKLMDGQRFGSGFLYRDKKGTPYIITCAHVIEMAKAQYGSIIAKDGIGNEFVLELLAADTFYDIAVLKFSKKQPKASQYAYNFNKVKAKIREKVYALGNVRGNEPNITIDVTISKNEDNFENDIGGYGYLMVKGNLKRGMSGGPVVNAKNKVVGITSRAKLYKGDYDDFSVILDGMVAKKIIDELISTKERIPRVYLGLVFQQKYKSKKPKALNKVIIKDVVLFGTANSLFKKKHNGKVITKINQTPIQYVHDVYKALEKVRHPAQVTLQLEGKNGIETIKIATQLLNNASYKHITIHYFRNHPSYLLIDKSYGKGLKTLFIHKKKIGDITYSIRNVDLKNAYPFQVAGYGNGDDKLYYRADSKIELGKIIKLHAKLGQFQVKNIIDVTPPKTIKNIPSEVVGLFTLRTLYY